MVVRRQPCQKSADLRTKKVEGLDGIHHDLFSVNLHAMDFHWHDAEEVAWVCAQ